MFYTIEGSVLAQPPIVKNIPSKTSMAAGILKQDPNILKQDPNKQTVKKNCNIKHVVGGGSMFQSHKTTVKW